MWLTCQTLTAALKQKKEELGNVAGASIPLTKEPIVSAKKPPFSLQSACVWLLSMISALCLKDKDDQETTGFDSMVLPMSKKVRRGGEEWHM